MQKYLRNNVYFTAMNSSVISTMLDLVINRMFLHVPDVDKKFYGYLRINSKRQRRCRKENSCHWRLGLPTQ